MWYSLLLLGYKPVQHVTVLNTVGNCNTVVSIIILDYKMLSYGTTVVHAVRRWRRRLYAAPTCIWLVYFVIRSLTYLLPILACSHLTLSWNVVQNQFSSAAEEEISNVCIKSNCFRPSEPVMLVTPYHALGYRGTSAAGMMQWECLLTRDMPKCVSRANCVEGEILRSSVP